MKIVTVSGARPQFIKASFVTAAFSCRFGMEEVVVHTGQHFDANMSVVFLPIWQCPCLVDNWAFTAAVMATCLAVC